MNEVPTACDELISRHFDRPLSSHDHQRLTDVILTDPAARAEFVGAARLHAGLEALVPPLNQPRKGRSAKWLSVAAVAAALVTGGAFFILYRPQHGPITITMTDPPPWTDNKAIKPKSPALIRRVVKTPAARTLKPLKLGDLFSRYYVDVSPHGLTVPQALTQLEEAIKAVNLLNREELSQLTFTAGAPHDPALPDPIVYAKRKTPMPVSEYIWACSHYREVVQQPELNTWKPEMAFSGLSAFAGPPMIREFRVPPDFLSAGEETPPYPEGNATAAKLARNIGIRLAQNESATFSPGPATITVSANPATLQKLEQRLGLLFNMVPKQVFVTTQYMKLPRVLLPAGFNEETGLILNKDEYDRFSSLVLSESQAAIVGSPSIIIRTSQQGKIHVTREVGSIPDTNDYVGMTQTILPVLSGELIRVEGLVELGVLDGLEMPGGLQALGLSARGAPLPQYFRTEYELWLPPQSTGMFVVDSPQSKDFVTLVCLTATSIDPAGLPIK